MANTKLDKLEKQELKELKTDAKAEGVQFVNLDDCTVMAYKQRGNTVEYALSVMSPDEDKFRVDVGIYHALMRFFNEQTVKMAVDDFSAMCENVWDVYVTE